MIEVDSKHLIEIKNVTYFLLYENFRMPFTGCEVKYFPNGNLKLKKFYLLGKLDGLYETYYEDGQAKVLTIYKDGKLDGPYETYYEDGQAKVLTIYKDGKLDGPYEEYTEVGNLIINANYKDNVRHGYYERYQNGHLFFCAQYENGKVKESTKKFFRDF